MSLFIFTFIAFAGCIKFEPLTAHRALPTIPSLRFFSASWLHKYCMSPIYLLKLSTLPLKYLLIGLESIDLLASWQGLSWNKTL